MGAAAGDPRGGERPMELKAFSRLMTSRSLGCRGQISEKEMNVTPLALLRPAVIHQKEFHLYGCHPKRYFDTVYRNQNIALDEQPTPK